MAASALTRIGRLEAALGTDPPCPVCRGCVFRVERAGPPANRCGTGPPHAANSDGTATPADRCPRCGRPAEVRLTVRRVPAREEG
jgi:hypothetical protein